MSLRLRRPLRAFARDRAGASLMEFALILPVITMLGLGGLELTNLILAHQKVERLASTSADVLARNKVKPNERQINDSFAAIDLMSKPYDIRQTGRVILTGIIGTADNSTGKVENKVAWQRCDGNLKGQTSAFGKEWKGSGDFASGPNVVLPNDIKLTTGQMVVISEVFFKYTPMVSSAWLPANTVETPFKEVSIHRTRAAAFTSITPIAGVTARTC